MKCEVIMSAYNDPDVLNVTLEGFLKQSDQDFSVCIADDGSGPEVKQVAERFSDKGLNIRHVWHEDIDLVKRLQMHGVSYSGKLGRAVVYHLEHPVREADDGNIQFRAIKQFKLATTISYCSNGLQRG